MSLQEDWRWCGVCEGLVYKGFGDGLCFDEGPHELGSSGPYGVGFDTPPDQGFEEGWLWCGRCQGLVLDGHDGRCFDGQAHDLSGSRPYWVHFENVPPGAQDGWRWCSRCSRLIYNGYGDGICWDGDPHDLSQGGAYSVDMLSERPPVPERLPSIVVTERSSRIEVTGTDFTPGGAVTVAFVRGDQVKKAKVRADEAGSFEHVERDARSGGGTGTVIARDESTPLFALRTLQLYFPWPPDGPVPIDTGTVLHPE